MSMGSTIGRPGTRREAEGASAESGVSTCSDGSGCFDFGFGLPGTGFGRSSSACACTSWPTCSADEGVAGLKAPSRRSNIFLEHSFAMLDALIHVSPTSTTSPPFRGATPLPASARRRRI
ncbi:MAG: hypothetical protein K6E40_03200, partial [Desulfovibrio sp.]|nr:hypothetical protein [Desulfovibrio sp.]